MFDIPMNCVIVILRDPGPKSLGTHPFIVYHSGYLPYIILYEP